MTQRGRGQGRHTSAPSSRGPRGSAGDGRSGGAERSGGRGRSDGADRVGLTALRDRLTGVIRPVTEQAGFDLERVSVSRVGRRHQVQVVVDRDEGVGLDAIAEVSREVSAALDGADQSGDAVIPGEYVLEVSSPGVERPLTEPRHWRRNLGRLVSVPVTGEGRLTGRVLAADPDGVRLGLDEQVRELPYARLGAGRVEVELRHLEEDQQDGSDPDEQDEDRPDGKGGA